MATPTINTDLTLMSAANSTTDWSGWGANASKWDTDTEIYLEGTASLALAPSSTGDGGYGYDIVSGGGSTFDATSNLILIWVKVVDRVWVGTKSNYGVYIRLTSATNWTDYYDYQVGGSDVAWTSGGWHLIVLDTNRGYDRTGGTAPTLTAVRRVGVGFNVQYTSSKSNSYWIDAMRYGTYYEITGDTFTDATNGIDFNENGASADTVVRQDAGSWITDGYEQYDWIRIQNAATGIDGDYEIQSVSASTLTLSVGDFTTSSSDNTSASVLLGITLEDVYNYDIGTTTYFYGVVTKSTTGAWEINFPLTIGDISGSNNIWFRSVGEVIYFTDQPIDPTTSDLYLKTAQDTGSTVVTFGNSTGTGDSRVGFGGSLITQNNTTFAGLAYLDVDAVIDGFEFFGTTCLGLTGNTTFASDTSHLVTSCLFVSCGQISLNTVEARKLQFIGYAGAADSALLWNESIDIRSSQFYSNTRAIEHPSAAGSPYSYIGLVFAGNTYDVNNSSGSSITINQTADAQGVNSNASSYTGSTTTFVNTKTLKVTVKDLNGSPINLAQVAIYDGSTELMNTDTNSSGVAQVTDYNYSTDTQVTVRVRKSSTGDSRYIPISSPQTITSNGLDVTITLILDSTVS